MMLYKLLVLVALALTANGAKKHVEVDVALNYVLYGALDEDQCCYGKYSLQIIMDKGLSEWIPFDIDTGETLGEQVQYFNFHMPLKDNKPIGSIIKGYAVHYAIPHGLKLPESYVADHDKLGFQGLLQMQVCLSNHRYPLYTQPSCDFTAWLCDEDFDIYTVVCYMRIHVGTRSPLWWKMISKEFPGNHQACFFINSDTIIP